MLPECRITAETDPAPEAAASRAELCLRRSMEVVEAGRQTNSGIRGQALWLLHALLHRTPLRNPGAAGGSGLQTSGGNALTWVDVKASSCLGTHWA